MADPLSVIGSLLAIATAGVQSTRSLKGAVERYKTRDTTLRRLLDEAGDAERVLAALRDLLAAAMAQPALDVNTSIATLLREPIERCSEVCQKFEIAMGQFSKKSNTSFLDWAKMEFMRGDINQFLDTLAGYKATISVGLGVLTMQTVRLSHRALEEYDELVKNTIYDLQLRLQRIDDKMHSLTQESVAGTSRVSIDLDNERQVTEQCLRICQDAKFYFESLARRDARLLQEAPEERGEDDMQDKFEAELITRQIFNDNQRSLEKVIGRLRERLESVLLDGDAGERSRLQEDIKMSTQCLEVCRLASTEVSNQKIHIIGEATADGDSDHMVVTTLADMFKVGKTISKNRSAMLVGSMSDEALMKLSHDRYNSRFGVADMNDPTTHGKGHVFNCEAPNLGSTSSHQRDKNAQPPRQKTTPTSNEMRRRIPSPESFQKTPREE